MALYGSSVPLDSGGFAVTVVCPNAYSHTRLMQLLNTIVPEAADVEALVVPVAIPPAPPEVVAEEVPADDDESTLGEPPRKDWTACNIQSGECE